MLRCADLPILPRDSVAIQRELCRSDTAVLYAGVLLPSSQPCTVKVGDVTSARAGCRG